MSLRKVSVDFKTELSTSEVNRLLDEFVKTKLDSKADLTADWEIINTKR